MFRLPVPGYVLRFTGYLILKETLPMTINIKVLGPGCSNCFKVEANAKAAVAQLVTGKK